MSNQKLIEYPIRGIQLLLYLFIQIIFLPLSIIGLVIGNHKETKTVKKLNVSYSAVQALQYRWMMHYFGTREDKNSIEFVKSFPCESHISLLLVLGPLIISQKLFGFKTKFKQLDPIGEETVAGTPGRRLVMFDEAIHKYMDVMDQIVLLGSGFDLLAVNKTLDKDVKVFEIDQKSTLNLKKETLKSANIKHEWISFIPVDYDKESWSDLLIKSGFDNSKNTLFIWQSVSLFLDEEVVKQTLKEISSLCNEHSILVQDIYSRKHALGELSFAAKQARKLMEKNDEPWQFGLDFSKDPKGSINRFLQDCDLEETSTFIFGSKLDNEPFYAICESKRKL